MKNAIKPVLLVVFIFAIIIALHEIRNNHVVNIHYGMLMHHAEYNEKLRATRIDLDGKIHSLSDGEWVFRLEKLPSVINELFPGIGDYARADLMQKVYFYNKKVRIRNGILREGEGIPMSYLKEKIK